MWSVKPCGGPFSAATVGPTFNLQFENDTAYSFVYSPPEIYAKHFKRFSYLQHLSELHHASFSSSSMILVSQKDRLKSNWFRFKSEGDKVILEVVQVHGFLSEWVRCDLVHFILFWGEGLVIVVEEILIGRGVKEFDSPG